MLAMNKIISVAVGISAASIIGLGVVGCSKQEGGSGQAGLLDNELLATLPPSAVGFVSWDAQSPAYANFKKSFWGGGSTSSITMLESMQFEGKSELIDPLVKVIKKSGLMDTIAAGKDPIRRGVFYFDIGSDSKTPGAALYFTNGEGVDFNQVTARLETAIKEEGIPTSAEKSGGEQGFVADFSSKIDQPENPFKKMYFAGNKEKLAIATSTALAAQIFKEPVQDNGISKIKASAEFKKVSDGHDSKDNQFVFGFLDLARVLDAAKGFAPDGAQNEDIKNFPLTSVSFSRAMADTPEDQVLVSFSPKNELQKKIVSALSGSGKNDILNKVPGDTLVWISLDGKAIKSIKDTALSEAPPEEAEMGRAMLAPLDTLKALGIGVRNASGGSPFPELLIVGESDNSAQLANTLKQQLSGAIGMSGMPVSEWQDKDIAGVKVSYATSPFGVGAFIADANGAVVIASSEKAVTDALSAAKGSTAALAKSLPKDADDASSGDSLFVAYSDVTKLANMIESVQGNLAMFTGGQAAVDKSYTDSLRKIGTFVLSAKLKDEVLKVQTNYDAPKAQG